MPWTLLIFDKLIILVLHDEIVGHGFCSVLTVWSFRTA